MLAIARGLLARPRILLLDEPSMGLAPILVRQIFDIVREINSQGTPVLLVEQNAHLALKLVDYVHVMSKGQVVYSGPARELAADEARVQSLAGASAEEWTPHA